MLVFVIPETYTSVLFACTLRLHIIPAVIRIFSNKLGVWGWSHHGLLHAMLSKLGNTLPLFTNCITQECQVVSGHFKSFTKFYPGKS